MEFGWRAVFLVLRVTDERQTAADTTTAATTAATTAVFRSPSSSLSECQGWGMIHEVVVRLGGYVGLDHDHTMLYYTALHYASPCTLPWSTVC